MRFLALLVLSIGSPATAAPATPVIFPVPQEMDLAGPGFALTQPVRILLPSAPSANDSLLARILMAELSDRYGLASRTERVSRLPSSGRYIVAGAATNPLVKELCARRILKVNSASPGPEGYVLQTDGDVALVAGSDESGAFHGVQSLRQLVARDAAGPYFRGAKIRDWPVKPFRGVKLYLPSRDEIPFFKRFVADFAALYKYNYLILEVNAAMRLDRHPELNAGWIDFATDLISSRRDRPAGPHQEYQDSAHHDTGGGAILEKDEVADLVLWARQHYLEVIPELPALTHSYYLLTRHRELAEIGDAEWPDAYCPSNPKTYELLFDVFDEYIDVMKPKMLHVGHDEWRAPLGVCPRCRGKNPGELFAADIARIHAYLKGKNLGMTIWGDHLMENVRGKGATDETSPSGYKYRLPGALTPEQVKQTIPTDILVANWFWGTGEPGQGEANETLLEKWGFRQFYGNLTPEIPDWTRRSARGSVIGGAPSSWAATTEFNFGKDLMYDFLGCANLLWSSHWYDPKELGMVVQARMPEVRRQLSGVTPPSADGDEAVSLAMPAGSETKSVAIGEDASSLIFLHASEKPAVNAWAYRDIYNFVDTAALLGYYEVLYEDGFVTTVPIRYGVDILERTWSASRNPRAYCYRADPVDLDGNTYFRFEWVNPRLGKAIRQVTLHGTPGFRTSGGKAIAPNAILWKGLSMVKRRPFPEPGKATAYPVVP